MASSQDVNPVEKEVEASRPSEGGDRKKEQEKGKQPAAPVLPDFVTERLRLFEEVKLRRAEEKKEKNMEPKEIKITLPDGRILDGKSDETTPLDIAKLISKQRADEWVAAKVNGEMWDMLRPLREDCTLELKAFGDPEGQHVFWHSSAHILGQALEIFYGGHLCTGPPVEGGFYYDIWLPNDRVVKPEEFNVVQDIINKVLKQKQPFERVELTKDEALEMFKFSKYKREILTKKVFPDDVNDSDARVAVYRCGPLVDICRGPHIPNTARVKAFMVTKASSSYWLGKAENDVLQRVYAISFPDVKMFKEWKYLQEEAAKRDHRKIGKDQELFFFHQLSPGSCFFMPHGTRIYTKLIEVMRKEYRKRGFLEVISPNVYNFDLWVTSGHAANYSDNMFLFEVEKQKFGMKPMNCPGHCLMFQHRNRSYRELPLRIADFGVLHRNELSGTLSGLTRVRRFQQDDAHIFCRQDQVSKEIHGAIEFITHIYGLFGFEFDLFLSTRPDKYMGEVELWDQAEAALKEALESSGHPWKLNPGDGAFYGPKIDVQVFDALKRRHQLATIQLDFQLPRRFRLEYQTEGRAGEPKVATPVMIHRAILGSVERFIAILTEHMGGKWPLWISPRQVIVCSVSESHKAYAEEVRQMLWNADFYADADLSDAKLPKKIREAQLAQYNFILVVGEKETGNRTVTVRTRDNVVHGEKPLDLLLEELGQLVKEYK